MILKDLEKKIIPVIVINKPDDILKVGKDLKQQKINIMEITLRTSAAIDAIVLAAKAFPDMIIGAGSVLNVAQCKSALEAGAQFIVSPGLDKGVVMHCTAFDILAIPGCITPTEIMRAIDLEIKIIKFFPQNFFGGIDAMRSLHSVFPNIKFIPTGGIDQNNYKRYLNEDFVFAVGGSWFFKKVV